MRSDRDAHIASIEILGVRFDCVGMHQAIGIALDWISQKNTQRVIATPNPEFVVRAQKDEAFRSIINAADLRLTDGRGIQIAARFLGCRVPERLPGTDFMLELCQRLVETKTQIFLLGADPGIAARCAEQLQKKFSNLHIAGIFDGDASEAGDHQAIEAINRAGAQVLFVAFGAQKQELWIARNLLKMPNIRVAMGVGGAFDYISGNVSRAPKILREIGVEWLWRLMMQPKRIGRIFNAVIVFPIAVMAEKLKSGRKSDTIHKL